jgi:hypothetical protein
VPNDTTTKKPNDHRSLHAGHVDTTPSGATKPEVRAEVPATAVVGLEGRVRCGPNPSPAPLAGGRYVVGPVSRLIRPRTVHVAVHVQTRNDVHTNVAHFSNGGGASASPLAR